MPLYCILCHAPEVQKIVEQNIIYYRCERCQTKSSFSLNLDGQIKAQIENNKLKHFKVTGVIRQLDQILLIYRRAFPLGYDFVCGHIYYGETPEAAIKRKVLDETGLIVEETTPLGEPIILASRCRHGAASHEFYVFDCKIKGHPIDYQKEEVASIIWANQEEVKNLPLVKTCRSLIERFNLLNQIPTVKHGF